MWIGGQLLSLVEHDLSVSHDTIPIAGKNLIAMCNSRWRRIYLFSSQPISPLWFHHIIEIMLVPGTSQLGLRELMYPMQEHSVFVTDYHMNNSPK